MVMMISRLVNQLLKDGFVWNKDMQVSFVDTAFLHYKYTFPCKNVTSMFFS